jgi:hypothetical protein
MKAKEAANMIATRNGRSLTPIAFESCSAIGVISAAVALLLITFVARNVAPNTAPSATRGSEVPITSRSALAILRSPPVFCSAAPIESTPASRKITFHSIAR